MRIAGILLAAGAGTRFGGDKLFAPLAERTHRAAAGTAIGVAAAMHLAEALPDSLAVVRPADTRLSARLSETGLRIVECATADDGMGASLACGVAAASDADGWIIALADMPWIAPATIGAVAEALGRGGDIVAPSYRGRRGHPVGFARRHCEALAALTGDAGARSLLEGNLDRLALVDVDDPGILRDVDLPGQLGVPLAPE